MRKKDIGRGGSERKEKPFEEKKRKKKTWALITVCKGRIWLR